MFSPGAKSVRNGATFENQETSSVGPVDPTLTAVGTQPGAAIEFEDPSFPDAAMVAMPAARRLSMIGLWMSVAQGAVNRSPPRLRLAATKFRAVRRWYTRSRPLMMSDSQAPRHGARPPHKEALVIREKTWIAISWAPFATPEKLTPAPTPFPATTPATWVPWKHPLSVQGRAELVPVC